MYVVLVASQFVILVRSLRGTGRRNDCEGHFYDFKMHCIAVLFLLMLLTCFIKNLLWQYPKKAHSCFIFTIRNIKIPKCSVSEFESNFSEGKADSIFPLHHVLFPLLPSSLPQVKNNPEVFNKVFGTRLPPFGDLSIWYWNFFWLNQHLTMDFPSWKKLLLLFQPIACLPAPSLSHLPLSDYKLRDLMLCSALGVRQLPAGGEGIKNLWSQWERNSAGVMGSW